MAQCLFHPADQLVRRTSSLQSFADGFGLCVVKSTFEIEEKCYTSLLIIPFPAFFTMEWSDVSMDTPSYMRAGSYESFCDTFSRYGMKILLAILHNIGKYSNATLAPSICHIQRCRMFVSSRFVWSEFLHCPFEANYLAREVLMTPLLNLSILGVCLSLLLSEFRNFRNLGEVEVESVSDSTCPENLLQFYLFFLSILNTLLDSR